MADEPNVVSGIDFKSTFPFTQIFRSFRIAIHPSKIVLALVAMVLIYIGGRLLDGIWPADYLAVPNEIGIYQATRPEMNASQAFATQRADVRAAIKARYANKSLGEIKDEILKRRNDEVEGAKNTFNPDNVANTEDKARQIELRDNAISAAYARATSEWNDASALGGIGLFRTFYLQQVSTGHRIVEQAYAGQWFGAGGMIDQIMSFLIIGPAWAMRHHPIYFTLLGVWALLVWSIFGGAIARIAAVQVARDEKISIRQALGFSTAKFLSFVSAPIIPLGIILFIGFVVFLGGLLINIPFFGPIIAGVFFFLALAAGFVMTLVLLGLLGGFNLMYPTIAVEGSDSFDAISRSFSYLFARPWRLGFYTIIAAAYGTLCYVFMRYFLKLLLGLTHLFVGLGVFVRADSMQPLWPVMWPNPLTAPQLSYPLDHLTLSYGQYMGAWLIACWVYLVTAMLGAFAISFYFSSNTIIYVLMRHEVDATELDDVYLEQGEDELGELPPAPAPVAAPTDGPAANG